MRNGITILLLCFCAGLMYGQEQAVYTQYHLNPVLINPGATGFNGAHDILLNYRSKWSAFEGAPKTFSLTYSGMVNESVGLGGQLFTDRIGEIRTTQGQLSYAYIFPADNYKFGVGLSTAVQQFRISSVSDDPFIDNSDELLNEALDGVWLFDAGVGLYGEYDERFYFGLSFPNLIRERLREIDGDVEVEEDGFGYMLLFGYRFDITNHNFKVEPSILLRDLRRVPFTLDINLKLSFLEDQLMGGITYSVGEEGRFGVMIGTRINDLSLYYSYDVSFGDFQMYNNGSHELTLGYRLARRAKEENSTSQ